MWDAIDSRSLSSLQRSAASAALLSSLVECVAFLVKRLCNEKGEGDGIAAEDSEAVAQRIIEEQIGRIWDSLSSNRLKVEETTSSNLIAKLLGSLHGREGKCLNLRLRRIMTCPHSALFATAWETIAQRMKESRDLNPLLVATLLRSLRNQSMSKAALESSVISLARGIMNQSVEDVRNDFTSTEYNIRSTKGLPFLVDMLSTFREELFTDVEITKVGEIHHRREHANYRTGRGSSSKRTCFSSP